MPTRRAFVRDRRGSRVLTASAFATLVVMPSVPGVLAAGSPVALLALPVESIVVVLLLLAIRSPIVRRVVAGLFGAVVVAAIVLAALDVAFEATVSQPFSPVDDWPGVISAAGVVEDATGTGGVILILGAIVAASVALAYALARAALRVTRVIGESGRDGRIATASVTAAWMLSALFGAQIAPNVPVAASDTSAALVAVWSQTETSIRENQRFESALGSDPARGIPPEELLSALKGKDVVIAFVESYGRTAVESTSISAGVNRVLRAGQAELEADGYSARSAFLTSPTFGGVSWLAHSTLQSGVWVDSQQKYDTLTSTDRLTLSRAFSQTGWRTVAVVPSNEEDWPVGGSFYGYDAVSDARNMGYRGPSFSYARMPDQYTWKRFYDRELSHPHPPLMAEVDLVSSHTPWTPLPRLVPWAQVGDGSVFDPQPAEGLQPVVAWADQRTVQKLYGESVEYSLSAMFSFLHTYPQPNLVLIFVGDHQPARVVSGPDADHDVPITIIAQDTEVFARIASWHWQKGTLPSPDAPVWRMDLFRDRFLDAFSR